MNWEAIGAIGEIVGAIAVVVSLIYLALQIRHGSATTEDAAYRDSAAAITEQFTSMMEGPNAAVVLKGLKDFRTLTIEEKYKFDLLMGSLVILVESNFISNQAQFISDETMSNWSFYLRRYLAYPGWQDWWAQNKGMYVLDAQSWIDDQIAQVDVEYDYWGIKTPSDRSPDSDA